LIETSAREPLVALTGHLDRQPQVRLNGDVAGDPGRAPIDKGLEVGVVERDQAGADVTGLGHLDDGTGPQDVGGALSGEPKRPLEAGEGLGPARDATKTSLRTRAVVADRFTL
jgi:hypothetical protein